MQEEHPEARFIVETLVREGFVAYYAGGWVRDYLLKYPSDDIDIATNASPEAIQALFPKTVPIGIAFGIILVLVGDKEFEVATFRNDIEYKDGRRPTRIEFTTPEEDAKRRDFTINGMFYDPLQDKVIDHVEGKRDLEKKTIRAIGNPHQRIKEDRLRMIRAVRLSCRLGFSIEQETVDAICAHAGELFPAVAMERIWQEFTKMAAYPGFGRALITLHDYGLLQTIFPAARSLSLKELKERARPLDDFPADTPVIAYLLELFPHASLEERLAMCKYLKLSKSEIQFVHFLCKAEALIQQKEVEKIEWAYFYASPSASHSLHVFAARLQIHDRRPYWEEHEKRKLELQPAILRIQQRTPVVTSNQLKELGVLPGVLMGKLLHEAERIAINEGIEDPHKVVEKLRHSPLWQQFKAEK